MGTIFSAFFLGFPEAGVETSVTLVIILEPAFAGFIADGTIQRMLGQQEFEDLFPGLLDLRARGRDLHAVPDPRGTGQLELGRAIDLDEAHPAPALGFEGRDDSRNAGYRSRRRGRPSERSCPRRLRSRGRRCGSSACRFLARHLRCGLFEFCPGTSRRGPGRRGQRQSPMGQSVRPLMAEATRAISSMSSGCFHLPKPDGRSSCASKTFRCGRACIGRRTRGRRTSS